MRFGDFHAGQQLRAGPVTLSQAQIVAYARDFDPQWFHVDPAAAAAGRHGGLIASGWQTCGVAMRLAVDQFLHDSESFGSPGLAYLRWPHPVRPDDSLTLLADVLQTRVSRSNPTIGILRWRWRLANQRGVDVLDLEATSLFELPAPGA